MDEQQKKILSTPAVELDTEEDLFRKYELSFQNFNAQGMIDAKKEWNRRFKREETFHRAYCKRVMGWTE